jgi:hypothetical protein
VGAAVFADVCVDIIVAVLVGKNAGVDVDVRLQAMLARTKLTIPSRGIVIFSAIDINLPLHN